MPPMDQQLTFMGLPLDIKQMVLLSLSLRSLVRLTAVSHEMRNIAKADQSNRCGSFSSVAIGTSLFEFESNTLSIDAFVMVTQAGDVLNLADDDEPNNVHNIPVPEGPTITALSTLGTTKAAVTNKGQLLTWDTIGLLPAEVEEEDEDLAYCLANKLGRNYSTADSIEQIVQPAVVRGPLLQRYVQSVSVGFSHTAAVTTDGSVFTWGANEYFQLGHDEDSWYHAPEPRVVKFDREQHTTAVSCGEYHTVFLTSDGEAYTCGSGLPGLGYNLLGLTDVHGEVKYTVSEAKKPRQVIFSDWYDDESEEDLEDGEGDVLESVCHVAAGARCTVFVLTSGIVHVCSNEGVPCEVAAAEGVKYTRAFAGHSGVALLDTAGCVWAFGGFGGYGLLPLLESDHMPTLIMGNVCDCAMSMSTQTVLLKATDNKVWGFASGEHQTREIFSFDSKGVKFSVDCGGC